MSEPKQKSILDGIEVEDSAFPLRKNLPEQQPSILLLAVVGHCPSCGSPVYGDKYVVAGETPRVTRSCACQAVALALGISELKPQIK